MGIRAFVAQAITKLFRRKNESILAKFPTDTVGLYEIGIRIKSGLLLQSISPHL
jgi:hypothetical protein